MQSEGKLDALERFQVVDAVCGPYTDGTAKGPRWPATTVLAWECGRRQDIDRAASLFAAAYSDAVEHNEDLDFITGLAQRLSLLGSIVDNSTR